MAKLRGNLFGGYTGKLGLNYGRYVHGVNLGAIMPTKRDASKSSAQQKDLMERFAALGTLASGLLNAIRLGLKVAAKAIGPLVSEFDAFVKINKDAVTAEGGSVVIEFGELKIAKGNLPQVGFGQADFGEPLTVKLDYAPNSDVPGADVTDNVYLVVYEPTSKQSVTSAPVQRGAGSISVSLPSTWSGIEVHVYGFAVGNGTDNKGVISNSTYIGTGIVG